MRIRTLALATPALVGPALIAIVASVQAQDVPPTEPVSLPAITVSAPTGGPPFAVSPQVEKFAYPQTIETVDQKKIADTVNIVDTEDGLKYMPSLFVRKRNYGDTQPTLATPHLGDQFERAHPRLCRRHPDLGPHRQQQHQRCAALGHGLAEEIKGMDMLYGPFAAAYPATPWAACC